MGATQLEQLLHQPLVRLCFSTSPKGLSGDLRQSPFCKFGLPTIERVTSPIALLRFSSHLLVRSRFAHWDIFSTGFGVFAVNIATIFFQ
jgi:hypothetical protein